MVSNELWIAVCDDMPSDLEHICTMTSKILDEAKIEYTVEKYESGEELLTDIRNGRQFHILLLDVMLGETDGMKLTAELRAADNRSSVIFVSANRDMAIYGYRVGAVRYLEKPVTAEDLKEALTYCYGVWTSKKAILLPTDKGQYKTAFSDILYVEAYDRGTKAILKDRALDVRMKFSDVEALLPRSSFLLCHRGFIINLGQVEFIHHYEFILKNGVKVPIGKARYTAIKNKYVEYITD